MARTPAGAEGSLSDRGRKIPTICTKRTHGSLPRGRALFFAFIVSLCPATATSSDLRALAKKVGVDYKKITPVIIKFGTMAPADTPWMSFPLEHIIKKIKEDTEGAVRIQIFAGGDDVTIINKMKTGEFLGCGCTSLGITAAVPEISVFSLPFLFRNYDEVDHITHKFRKDIAEMFSQRGYRLFAIIDTGFLYLFTKDKVSSLNDLKQTKLANWQGEIEKITFSELKAGYIPVSVPELYTSLQSGLIQGSITPPGWELATQSFLYVHYFIDTPFFYSIAAVMAEEKHLRELEKKYPPGFIDGIAEYIASEMSRLEKDWRAEIRDFERKCIHAFINSGRVPVPLSQSDKDSLSLAAKNVKKKLAGRVYSQEFVSKVESELIRYRKQAGNSQTP